MANEIKEPYSNNQQSNHFPLQQQLDSSPSDLGEQTPYPGTSQDRTEATRVLNLFGDNVVTDNLDYINTLLKSQFTDNIAPKNQKGRKRQTRQENVPSSAQTTEEVTSPTLMNNALSPPVNSPNIFPEKGSNISDHNSSFMSPIEPVNNGKVEVHIATSILENADIVLKGRHERNSSGVLETCEEFYKRENNDAGKRSMSVEDIKIISRDFNKGHGATAKNAVHNTSGNFAY